MLPNITIQFIAIQLSAPMKDVDIIYFTLFPWDHPYSSVSFSLAKEFIKHNRVFYVNPPYSYKDLVTTAGDKYTKERMPDLLMHRMRYEQPQILNDHPNQDSFKAVMPPIVPPINFLKPGGLYDKMRTRNNKKLLKTIQRVIKENNIKNYIYLNCFNPYYGGTLPRDSFNPMLNIYQCIDDISQNSYTNRHGLNLERQAIQMADITTVTSTELKNIWQKDANEIHLVPNAADIDLFKQTIQQEFPRPEEIKHVKNKIIGFVGNLDADRIDYPLIKKVAEKHSDKTILLIGPNNNTELAELKIDKLPNVIMTGSKDITQLPPYLHYFDVAMIPFQLNKLTKSIYPLKINEYLAAGRAVVATDFSTDIRSFNDIIDIGTSHDQFIQLIDKAIAENSIENVEHRVRVANSNTWTDRVSQIWSIVDRKLSKQTVSSK